jgi:amidohydrolase
VKTSLQTTIQEAQVANIKWLKSLKVSDAQDMVKELANCLEGKGCSKVTTYDNGVITAYLTKPASNKTVGLRGMYSSPILQEENAGSYLQGMSQIAILLTVADILQRKPDRQSTTVKFILEPINNAAPQQIPLDLKEEIWQDIDVLYGASLIPNESESKLFVSEGPAFASLDHFDIHIQGLGGHAAYPNKTVDALIVAAQIIEELQLTVSRGIDPMVPTALTVTSFEAGEGTFNIIADSAQIKGNVRTLAVEEGERVETLMTNIVHNISQSHGAEGKLTYHRVSPVFKNDERLARKIKGVFIEAFGSERVDGISSKLTTDYFAKALEEKPGTIFYIGTCGEMETEASISGEVLTTGIQAFLELINQ